MYRKNITLEMNKLNFIVYLFPFFSSALVLYTINALSMKKIVSNNMPILRNTIYLNDNNLKSDIILIYLDINFI